MMEDPSKGDLLMWSSGERPKGRARARGSRAPRGIALEVRRAVNAAAMQSARARESPEEAAARKGQNASATMASRLKETPEQAAERRARNAAAMQAARLRESPEAAGQRRALNAARMEALRARETPEQTAMRRAQNAARMQALRSREGLGGGTSSQAPTPDPVGPTDFSSNRFVLIGKPGPIHDEVMERAVLAAKAEQKAAQEAADRRHRDLETVLADIRKSKEILAASHQEAARQGDAADSLS